MKHWEREIWRRMNKITYDQRVAVYTNALIHFGKVKQLIVALEELSECQKEICKVMRGQTNLNHLAEEVADATIMLEQVREIFSINDLVCEKMDEKIRRLDGKLRGDGLG